VLEQVVAIATRGYPNFVVPDDLSNWKHTPAESGEGYLATNLIGTTDRFTTWLLGLPADK